MKWLLNSAVITAFGTYTYERASVEDATDFVEKGGWASTIGYEETAQALSELVGANIPVNRRVIVMEPGDMALVFRLVFPVGFQRPDPAQKGALGIEFIREHCEIGILTRVA
jgi:hypothetical protein